MRLVFLLLLMIFLQIGCANVHKLEEKYPLAEISRPYTLLYGLKSWNTIAIPVENNLVANPLIWETPLTESFSVMWVPLPLGLKLQLMNTESHRLGVSAMYLLLGVTTSVDYRYRLADSWAFELSHNYLDVDTLIFRIKMSTVSAGPLYQITDRMAVKPYLSTFSGSVSAGLITQVLIDSIFGDVRSNTSTTFSGTGAGLDLFYSFNYQWNMKLGVAVLNTNNVGSHTSGNFALTHIW